MVQRNHRAEALKRFATQIPTWASWGGRSNAYAIEWTTAGTGTDFYSGSGGPQVAPNSSLVLWLKPTATLTTGTEAGVFGFYDSAVAMDAYSLQLEGTASGNVLSLYSQGGTLIYTTGVIGTSWTCIQIDFDPATLNIYLQGVLNHTTGAPPALLPFTTYTLGRTESLSGTVRFLETCIVDEVALFDAAPVPATIYNSGVPPTYTTGTSGLIASYEVERDTGAIHARFLSPTVTGSGQTPPTFTLGALTTQRPEVTTSALRSTSTNPYRERVSRLGAWVSGSAVDGAYAVSGTDISAEAPGLMASPAGWGYSTLGYTGAFVGNEEEPGATPALAVSGSGIGVDDSTDYDAVGGSSSLGGVVDARERRLLVPRFVKR